MSETQHTVIRAGQSIEVGVAVDQECDEPGCTEKIVRVYDFVCGEDHGDNESGCGKYFCSQHLYLDADVFDADGDQPQLCADCAGMREPQNDAAGGEDPDTETETFKTIRYTADVVAVDPDGRVLLIERRWEPFTGAWALPGGHTDINETSRAAGARELKEETGLDVDPDALVLIGVYDAPFRDPRGRYVTVAYLARVPAGTTARAGDDAAAVRWAPLDALPEDLAFDHHRILADAMHLVTAHAHH